MYEIAKRDINDEYSTYENIASPNVRGAEITSGAIDLEVNEPGTLTFTLRRTHPAAGTLRKLGDVIRTITDGWRYDYWRVVDVERDFFKNETITCEGVLGILGDYYCLPIFADVEYNTLRVGNYDGYQTLGQAGITLEKLLRAILVTSVNEQTSLPYYNATISNIAEPPNVEELANSFSGGETVLQAVRKVIDEYGGFVSMGPPGYASFTMATAPGATRTEAIEYGKNLVDLKINESATDLYTSCLGIGEEVQGDTEQTHFGNNWCVTAQNRNGNLQDPVYVDASAALIARYGRRVIMKKFDGLKTPAAVYKAAKRYINMLVSQSVSIEIKAIDLKAVDASAEGFTCGDLVPIRSVPHGIDGSYLCSKAHIDLTDLSQTYYMFGATPKTLSAMAARAK